MRLSRSSPGRRFTHVHPWERYLHPAKVIVVLGWLWITLGTDLDRPLISGLSPRLAGITEWIGAVMGVAGIAFACWARLSLGRHFSARLAVHEAHALVTEGPYRLARHPMYTGFFLGVWGWALALDTLAGLLAWGVALPGIFCLHTYAEEALLTERFGDAYRRYVEEVPRLIPRLAGRRR